MNNTNVKRQFYNACALGEASKIKRFLAEGVKLEEMIDENFSPLHASISHPDIVKTLVSAGMDINLTVGDEQLTPLHHAAAEGDWRSVSLLISLGADPCKKSTHAVEFRCHTPLEMALCGGLMEGAESLSNSLYMKEKTRLRLACVKKWMKAFPDMHGLPLQDLVDAAYLQRNRNGDPLPFLETLLECSPKTDAGLAQEMLCYLANLCRLEEDGSNLGIPLKKETFQDLMLKSLARGAVWTPKILDSLKDTDLEEWSSILAMQRKLSESLEVCRNTPVFRSRL